MLSYFKYYIIKTQQARKSIVLKLYGYAAAFRPDVWGVWSDKWEGARGCRNITVPSEPGFSSRWYTYESVVAAGRAADQNCSFVPLKVLPL